MSKVSITCWQVQNLFVLIITRTTLDPVNRIRINFQDNLSIYHLNDLWYFIELFLELTNLLAKQKGISSIVTQCSLIYSLLIIE